LGRLDDSTRATDCEYKSATAQPKSNAPLHRAMPRHLSQQIAHFVAGPSTQTVSHKAFIYN